MKKKLLSVFLSLALILTCLPGQEVRGEAVNKQEITKDLTENEMKDLAEKQLKNLYAEAYKQATEYQQTKEYQDLMKEAVIPLISSQQEEVKSNYESSKDLDADSYAAWKEEYAESLFKDTSKAPKLRAATMLRAATSLNGNIMSNEYIGACINSEGSITLGTTGGNPDVTTDDNKKLIFGYPGSSTTYTTVRVDGADYRFSPNGGIQFYEDGSKCIATMTVDDVTIEQVVAFDMNYSSGREDMARIKYMVTNNGTTSHSVGIRIMLDTMLGGNDGAPFRIPGIGNVTKEIELSGNSIPQYWQAFDSLDQPSVIANGCLYKSVSTKPDKVQFAYWGDIVGQLWDYTVTSSKYVTRDSAVAIYYDPKSIAAGGQRNVETYYGIGDTYTGSQESELTLRIVAPVVMIANNSTGSYESNPFIVTAYIKNNGSTTARNVRAALSLPSNQDLMLVGNSGSVKMVGDIASGAEKTVTFKVKANAQSVAKNVSGTICLSSSNCELQQAQFTIQLPKVGVNKTGSITLNKTFMSMDKGSSQILIATLNNISGPVTWVSTRPDIASVNSSGKVTAKAYGKATIKASASGKTASCTVSVKGTETPVASMYFTSKKISLDVKESRYLGSSLVYLPQNVNKRPTLSWKSSNPSVVSVFSGRINGLKEGTATITAYIPGENISATTEVTVSYAEPELPLQTNADFNANESGPVIKFADHEWPLFDLPVGINVYLGRKVELSYDDANDKYIASFGDVYYPTKTNDKDKNGKLTPEAKQLRKDAYQSVKKLMNMVGKKTNQDFYNTYRSLVKKSGPMAITGDKSIFGYVEFTRTSNGGYALGGGEVCVLFTAGVSLKYNFPPAPVVYIRFGITGTLQTGLRIRMLESGNISKGVDVSGEIAIALKPSVGIGGDIGIANIEGGLEGNISATINLRPWYTPRFSAPRDLKLQMKANLYLSYKVFLFINGKKTWPIADFTIYPKQSARSRVAAAIATRDLEPISSEYTQNPSYFVANRWDYTNDMDSSMSSQLIKSNVYPYGEPKIAELGHGTYLMIWLDHDSTREIDENATALYYSYYNGYTWSKPSVIDQDGTCDFAPELISDGKNAWVAWQNSEIKYTEGITLDEVASTIGLKAAKFEDEKFTYYTITEPNQMTESAPVFALEGNNVTMVWTCNSENDVFGINGTNTIYKAQFANNEWSKPEEVYTETGYMGTMSVAMLDYTLYIAYMKDLDGQVETSEDNEIKLIIGDQSPVTVTNNQTMDTNPKLIVNDGSVQLYWYEDGCVHYKENVLGEQEATILSSQSPSMNFNVVTNGTKKAILWEAPDGFGTNLKAIYYDMKSKQWGDVLPLTNQPDRIRESQAILTREGNLEIAFILAELVDDYEEAVSPYGECNLILLEQTPKCDLAVGDSILFDEDEIKDGGTINLGIYVKNNGQIPVDGFLVEMLRNGEVLQSKEVTSQLIAGQEEYYEIPYVLDTPFEAHTVDVRVTPLDDTDDRNGDNTVSVALGSSKIMLSQLAVTGNKETRNVSVQIKNMGYVDSNPLYVEMVQSDGENEVVQATTVIDSIGKQDETYADFELPISADLFKEDGSSDSLIYIRVYDYQSMQQLDYSFTNLPNPYNKYYLEVSDVSMIGNAMVVNVDNNLPEAVTGQLYFRHELDDDHVVVYGQEISLDRFYGQSYEIDLTGINTEGGTLAVYVVDEEGNSISNEVYVDGMNTAKARMPIADVASGAYETPQIVTLTAPEENTAIYYTTDGTDPDVTASNTILYAAPIAIDTTTTLKAISVNDEMLDSDVAEFEYVLAQQKEQCAMPIALVTPGTYDCTQSVVLAVTGSAMTATPAALIYYTTDGSDPKTVTGSSLYTQPITVDQSMVIKAYVTCEDMEDSYVAEFAYTIEQPQYTVDFHIVNQWNDGFQAEMKITNLTDEIIRNWKLSFDADFDINNLWNGIVKDHNGTSYLVQFADWNQMIQPGNSVTFGFTAKYNNEVQTPYNYRLDSEHTKQEEINCDLTYEVISAWDIAYQGAMHLKNHSTSKVVDWTAEFDFDGEISTMYTADIISHVGNHYVIKGKDYNRNLEGNAELYLQFEVSTPQIPLALSNIKVY